MLKGPGDGIGFEEGVVVYDYLNHTGIMSQSVETDDGVITIPDAMKAGACYIKHVKKASGDPAYYCEPRKHNNYTLVVSLKMLIQVLSTVTTCCGACSSKLCAGSKGILIHHTVKFGSTGDAQLPSPSCACESGGHITPVLLSDLCYRPLSQPRGRASQKGK